MDLTRKDGGVSQQLQLTITVDTRTGAINVVGPIENKIVALGMIEMAKAAILAYVPGTGLQLPQRPVIVKPA